MGIEAQAQVKEHPVSYDAYLGMTGGIYKHAAALRFGEFVFPIDQRFPSYTANVVRRWQSVREWNVFPTYQLNKRGAYGRGLFLSIVRRPVSGGSIAIHNLHNIEPLSPTRITGSGSNLNLRAYEHGNNIFAASGGLMRITTDNSRLMVYHDENRKGSLDEIGQRPEKEVHK